MLDGLEILDDLEMLDRLASLDYVETLNDLVMQYGLECLDGLELPWVDFFSALAK